MPASQSHSQSDTTITKEAESAAKTDQSEKSLQKKAESPSKTDQSEKSLEKEAGTVARVVAGGDAEVKVHEPVHTDPKADKS